LGINIDDRELDGRSDTHTKVRTNLSALNNHRKSFNPLVAVSGLPNLLAAGLQTGIKNYVYFRALSIYEQHLRLLDIGMF